ncbi:MAG: LamG domain-containing protein [Planctomycetota bacterium]|jgi:hypothetical protein|nr:LamG domain-containing protein [Planctomycetota bacterium]
MTLELPILLTVCALAAQAPKPPSATAVSPPTNSAPGGWLGGTDDCVTPMPIAGQGTFPFDHSAATTGTAGQSESLCFAFGTSGIENDVWYCWTADADGCAELTTCGLTATDTKVAAYPGCGCPAPGTALACNDDACGLQSTIGFPVSVGTTYTLQVGTFPGASPGSGSFTLQIQPCPTPAPIQLVGHYRLDEATGAMCMDSSGNGFDGTYLGGVTLAQPGAAATTNLSVEFDHTQGGHASIPTNPTYDAMQSDLSVAAWIHPESFGSSSGGIMRIFGNSCCGGSWSFGVTNSGLRFTTIGVQDYDFSVAVPLNAWSHVAIVFDLAFDVRFYLDGVPVGSVAGGASANLAGPTWNIGTWDAAIEYWDGLLDDVQVYSGSLADGDVAFLFANPGATVSGTVGTAYCFGDGSGGVCPCGNLGGTGEGCGNSTGQGATTLADGSTGVGADDVTFGSHGLLPGQPALLFSGNNTVNGGNGVIFGDGLRCAGTAVKRLGVRVPDAAGGAAWGPGLAPMGQWGAGDTRRFQVWYRDPNASPCGSSFNLSHGVEVTFTP